MRTALFSILLAVGCTTGPEIVKEPVPGRDDLAMFTLHTSINDGLSEEITLTAPEGISSVLFEIRGDKGLYQLTRFRTPRGELIEGAAYQTRFAREVPGLVDWLYPNTPKLSLEPGEYKFTLYGENKGGDRIDEDIEIRIYAKKQQSFDTCGIHLDFLIDANALAAEDFDAAVDRMVVWANDLYAPRGVQILDYSITKINLPNPRFNVNETDTVMGQIDDVLRQARSTGTARKDSVHVVVVRTIGGSEPSGYAMGLPGPFDADRPNAAVLVSTDAYTDGQGQLNVDGLASTVAHEVGHFMGLYHTSESSGNAHDPIDDTPSCGDGACSPEFEKNIMTGGGGESRNIFTAGQAFVVKQHPLCIPTEFAPPMPKTCTLSCNAPQTCSIVGGDQACRPACDPDVTNSCTTGMCKPDDMGTFVCQ